MDRAKAARDAGYEVVVLTSVDRSRLVIEGAGFRIVELNINRRSINPLSALMAVFKLVRMYRKEKPDIIHQVALKPILLGGLAARIAGIRRVVNAVVGGGYAFTSTALSMQIFRPLISIALRLLLNPPYSRVIFENKDDLASFVNSGWVRPEATILIRGAGVDLNAYSNRIECNRVPLVIVPARLLWDKGLGEFVMAAKWLKSQGVAGRFALVGGEDPDNRACIPSSVLSQWREEGDVELWGFQSNMAQVLAEADIVCLPSYREGLPKALLEGMAAGLACVTTDVPGCREAVVNGMNGLLVPPKDYRALALALRKLILDPVLRQRMGQQGKAMAANEFSSQIVCNQTLEVYKNLLQSYD